MPPDAGPELCSPELPAHHPHHPEAIVCRPCSVVLGCGGSVGQGAGKGLEVLLLLCPLAQPFDQRHSWDDSPGRPAQLSSVGVTASHQYCAVAVWGPCIQACLPHVKRSVHPTPDTHRLSQQPKSRFAWQAHLAVPAPNSGLVWPAQPCH